MNFLDAVEIVTPPGETNRIFVVERGGNIRGHHQSCRTNAHHLFEYHRKVTYDNGEGGLLSLAFHPGYATNGYFLRLVFGFDTTTPGSGAHDILARYQVSSTNGNFADPTNEVKLLRSIRRRRQSQRGDGPFRPDGYLYVSLGDEGPV